MTSSPVTVYGRFYHGDSGQPLCNAFRHQIRQLSNAPACFSFGADAGNIALHNWPSRCCCESIKGTLNFNIFHAIDNAFIVNSTMQILRLPSLRHGSCNSAWGVVGLGIVFECSHLCNRALCALCCCATMVRSNCLAMYFYLVVAARMCLLVSFVSCAMLGKCAAQLCCALHNLFCDLWRSHC